MSTFDLKRFYYKSQKHSDSWKTGNRKMFFTVVFFLLLISGAKAQDLDVPYVSTPHSVVEKMLDVADVGPGDYVIDLGCGDGRIVIGAALRGAVGHGIHYVFNGWINEDQITGKAQIRSTTNNLIKNWSAVRE